MTKFREFLETSGQDELLEQLKRLHPESYDEFVATLHKDLIYVVGLIEADSKDFHDALEDELNREIVRLLNARFYIAGHDTDENGHVDVHVRSRDGRFSWLAEAKIDKGVAYLTAGVHQLSDRYARGTPESHCGGFLVYIQKSRCAERFKGWRDHVSGLVAELEDLEVGDSTLRGGLTFNSRYVLNRMGEGVPKYSVLHIGVSAYRDASASGSGSAAP